jgi:hypothetical protein
VLGSVDNTIDPHRRVGLRASSRLTNSPVGESLPSSTAADVHPDECAAILGAEPRKGDGMTPKRILAHDGSRDAAGALETALGLSVPRSAFR